jgi:hypothetical protein
MIHTAQEPLLVARCDIQELVPGIYARQLRAHDALTVNFALASGMHFLCVIVILIGVWAAQTAFAGKGQQVKVRSDSTAKVHGKLDRAGSPFLLGLKFGVPLAGQLGDVRSEDIWRAGTAGAFLLCRFNNGKLGYARLQHPPDMGFDYDAMVMLVDGEVEDIVLNLRDEAALQVLRLLKSHFGKAALVQSMPANAEDTRGQSAYGWSSADLNIEFSQQRETPGIVGPVDSHAALPENPA